MSALTSNITGANRCCCEGSIKIGYWGGIVGEEWNYNPKAQITKIVICHGHVIDSITFKSKNRDPALNYSRKFGGSGGTRSDKIYINGAEEFITGISGMCESFPFPKGQWVVQSLVIHTNKSKYGPFGYTTGQPFDLHVPEGTIVGFCGRASDYIDAIGVYAKSVCSMCVSPSNNPFSFEEVRDVMEEVVPRETGPWGGCAGKKWDDGVFSRIKQIHVHIGKSNSLIHGVQFEYEKRDGTSVWSPMHGGNSGDTIKRIFLDCEDEFLVGVAGFYGPVVEFDGMEAIRSISFFTNKGKYGPFGKETGLNFTYFASTPSKGKVVGFHGSSNDFLTAIGVHMEYL